MPFFFKKTFIIIIECEHNNSFIFETPKSQSFA